MQHNYNNYDNCNNNCNMNDQCSNVPSNRCPEYPQQPMVPPCSVTGMANQNFPAHYVNPRFCVTPDTLGICSSAAYQVSFRERNPPPHIPPLVDVKPYYERHNKKLLARNISEVKLERNSSFASTKSNAPNSSYASIRSEQTVQNLVSPKPPIALSPASAPAPAPAPAPLPPAIPQPAISPPPPPPPAMSPRSSLSPPPPPAMAPITSIAPPPQPTTSSPPPSDNNRYHQWNFDNKFRQQQQQHQQECQQQQQQQQTEQPDQMSAFSSSAILCSTQSVEPLASTHHLPALNSPCVSTACCIARKASEDSCISASSSINEMPTSYFEKQLQKYNTGSDLPIGDSAKINYGTLNKMFLKRLQDIDDNVCGDKDLKLVTFQEWVDMLLKINDSFITNMEELEKEVAERLELVQQKVNTKCRYSQGNELMKCRKDIETLLKVLQNLYYNQTLDLSGVTFETINPAQILTKGENVNVDGNAVIKTNNDSEILQRNKLVSNIKALAHEVAEKHDELRELKQQIFCLEEDIQKAQQKIQFKDDVIKELRNDLKSANHKLSANSQSLEEAANLRMPPINFEHQTTRSGNTQISDCNTLTDENSSQFDSLSHTEHEEQQKIKDLEQELNEFFEISRELNKQKMENQRKRLMDIFQTAETEKIKAYRKLDYIRRQLIDLETNNAEGNVNDGDSGFHSKSENDQDAKIIDAVRKRLRKLSETNIDLKKKLQKFEMEKSELSTNLQSEKTFAQRNSETLRQVADLLSGMKAEQFSYTDIYNKSSNEQSNPFCEAIIGIKKAFQEKEQQLLKVLGIRNKQIEELLNNEKCFNEERISRTNLNDLGDVLKRTTPTSSLSIHYTPVQPATTTTTITTTTMSSSLTGQHVDSKVTTYHKGS